MTTYIVWNEDGGDRESGREIEAATAEDAAEDWACTEDSEGDYTILGGNDVVVCVVWDGWPEIAVPFRYSVAFTEPVYTAVRL